MRPARGPVFVLLETAVASGAEEPEGEAVMQGSTASRPVVATALAFACVVVAAGFALAACGDSGSTPSSSPSAAPSEAAASPAPSWSPTMTPAPVPSLKPGDKLPPFSELAALYEYDRSEPFDVKEVPAFDETVDGVTVPCFSFQSQGEPVYTYLVVPDGEGPFPVIIAAPPQFWENRPNAGAMEWARKGYASLLPGSPSPEVGCYPDRWVRYVVQQRRALDLLATMPEIDMQRIGFTGSSQGAILGALLAGVEDRIKAYQLDAPSLFSDETLTPGWTDADRDRWVAEVAVVDLPRYVAHNRGAALLFVSGKKDPPAMRACKAMFAAAPKPKRWLVHSSGHGADREAEELKDAWLVKHL